MDNAEAVSQFTGELYEFDKDLTRYSVAVCDLSEKGSEYTRGSLLFVILSPVRAAYCANEYNQDPHFIIERCRGLGYRDAENISKMLKNISKHVFGERINSHHG